VYIFIFVGCFFVPDSTVPGNGECCNRRNSCANYIDGEYSNDEKNVCENAPQGIFIIFDDIYFILMFYLRLLLMMEL
jgi:hypothetical protein